MLGHQDKHHKKRAEKYAQLQPGSLYYGEQIADELGKRRSGKAADVFCKRIQGSGLTRHQDKIPEMRVRSVQKGIGRPWSAQVIADHVMINHRSGKPDDDYQDKKPDFIPLE